MQLFRVILYVQDMATQVAFYRDMLGLTVKVPPGLDDYSEQYWVEFDTGATTLVLHGGGQKRIGEDAANITFYSDDLEVKRAELIARGVKLDEIRSPVPGSYVTDGFDPEGNRFSIQKID